MAPQELDRVLEKLAKDVENAVHALYRGEVRQQTSRTRTVAMVREAQAAIQQALKDAGGTAAAGAGSGTMPSPRPSVAGVAAVGESVGWTREEGEAVLKCITAWLPMGPPNAAPADSKCVSAMRELTPTWGQREKAREAVKRVSAS